jgi:hypothetical protein
LTSPQSLSAKAWETYWFKEYKEISVGPGLGGCTDYGLYKLSSRKSLNTNISNNKHLGAVTLYYFFN